MSNNRHRNNWKIKTLMKVLNEKQTEKLLKTNDVGLLKKLLKIKNKEDNYKITLE